MLHNLVPIKQPLLIIGHIAYVILAFLACYFYLERTIFVDLAFHTFHLLNNDWFAIQNQRFGAIFTQIFPLVAAKLGLPLKGVLLTYSLGFVVYYYSIFLLCTKLIKNQYFAIIMLLFSTLLVMDTFYWVQSELPQGLAFLLLFFAILTKKQQLANFKLWQIFVLLIMIVFLAYFHPLLVIPFTFLVAFFFVDKKGLVAKKLLIGVFGAMIVTLVLKNLLKTNTYETSALGGLKNFITLFPDYFFLKSNYNFIKWCLTDYYYLPILLGLLIGFYIKQKLLTKLGLVLSFTIGYLLLVNVCYATTPYQFYMENLYLPLSIFVIIPLVIDVFPTIIYKKSFITIFAFVIFVRVLHIGLNSHKFTARLNWNKQMLAQTKAYDSSKFLINEKDVPLDILWMTWGSSYESLLLSTLENPNAPRTFLIDENPDRFLWTLHKTQTYFTKWGAFDYDKLPKQYFNFTDNRKYLILEKEQVYRKRYNLPIMKKVIRD